MQSDKASVEITSPFDGVIKELLVQEGEVAKVGAGLCLIEVDEEAVEDADPAAVEPVAPTPQATPVQQAPPPPEPRVEPSEVKAEPPRRLHPLDPNYTTPVGRAGQENVLAAPSVRHFARVSGVDLAQLMPGSGKGGRVEKRDVEAHLSRASDPPVFQQTQAPVDLGQDVVVELGRTRYGMWKAMVKVCAFLHVQCSSHLSYPHFTELGNSSLWVRHPHTLRSRPKLT